MRISELGTNRAWTRLGKSAADAESDDPLPASEEGIFVVHPDPEVRQTVRRACESVRLKTLTWSSADDFLRELKPQATGALVAGLRIPGLNGPDLLAELSRRNQPMPAIIASAYIEPRSAVSAMKAGALDIFELPLVAQPLLDALHQALRVGRLARRARHHYSRIVDSLDELTRRESEVLEHLLAGRANKEIARLLDLSEKTVATHRNNILIKTGMNSLVELVRRMQPVLAMPQIFLNPCSVSPIDLLASLLD